LEEATIIFFHFLLFFCNFNVINTSNFDQKSKYQIRTFTMNNNTLPNWKDKILFTPGPLTTSPTIKQAMLRDLGSRDYTFIETIRDIRNRLLILGESSQKAGYEAILMQGSGTFSIEAVLSSTIPPEGQLLLIINGAYGKRMAKIAAVHNIDTITLEFPENSKPELGTIEQALKDNPGIAQIAVVHCETTTGIFNPIKQIGELAAQYKKTYFVDAMSSFGAVPVNIADCNIDYIVSSANKCVEGVPGFAFILAKKETLLTTKDWARTLSFDIYAQWKGLEDNGQFRFTPPTHTLLAFHQALIEIEMEGGVAARGDRYLKNYKACLEGMRKLGFKEYLKPEDQGSSHCIPGDRAGFHHF